VKGDPHRAPLMARHQFGKAIPGGVSVTRFL
jgi:hypothetical protein